MNNEVRSFNYSFGSFILEGYRCPVCEQLHDRNRSIYCSDDCRDKAKAWRKFARSRLVRYSVLGFKIEFELGCYPMLTTPEYLREFWPMDAEQVLIFPLWSAQVWRGDKLAISDACRNLYGRDFTVTINAIEKRKSETLSDYQARILKALRDIRDSGIDVFTCAECQKTYFDGDLAHWHLSLACSDCDTNNIPF